MATIRIHICLIILVIFNSCERNSDNEKYNIYLIQKFERYNIYIKRLGYNDLYYICNINKNDIKGDKKQFIDSNIENWLFYVLNETEED